ncbi:dynein beta chain, putative [Plasmodium berghei]|uniref:Dynein beta chain, putative n=2 Tax=Plasmodium berghei TaxID=5821 RepID=A0A509ANT6_PLABA|nr:dynein beta chain, putative [Plasmodium berghei ANKA]SCL97173.1 dynein beta chain, putative [Plasmodium berghei]SCM16567.1 dynein beta chain, putative [Plasmodium berghei]SCN27794.1 dynein beta chain, putative [Plasmodium berghei]VUC57678.1 dynein beta chain, putative [Plasmodium berghei ANKA]|eukprot:XP_034423448.1 dynein beta chain, putative [Plasmodium berghei ANKA]
MPEEISEDFIRSWIENKICLSKYSFNSIWNDDYNKIVHNWIFNANSKILYIYIADCDPIKLSFSFDVPNEIIDESINEYIIFLKVNTKKITYENIDNVILYNKIKCNIKENILNLMDRVFIPFLDMKNKSSIIIQNDFNITTIEFMTYITQLFIKNKLIYYPKIAANNIQLSGTDKGYVQIFERLLGHWINDIQKLFKHICIKELNYMTLCEYISDAEEKHNILKDLLEEVNFEIVNSILSFLEKNNCANVKKYNILIDSIKNECDELEEKLKALKMLKEPFNNFEDNISTENIYSILPIVVNRLKLIFQYSKYYKNSDKINNLITLLLNEFIKKLQNYIDLSKIYTKEVKELSKILGECINFVSYWDYLISISFRDSPENRKTFDSILHPTNMSNIIAFKNKCIDLKEICYACNQFMFSITEEDIKTFSYEHYHIIKKGFDDIKSTFFNELIRIRKLKYELLSIKHNEWNNDFKKTKELIKVLESIFINLIKISFENCSNIEYTIFLFDKFYTLAITENIKSFMSKKSIDIWWCFINYIDSYSKYFNNFLDNPLNYFSYNIRYEYHSSCIMFAKNISLKLHKIFEKLTSLYYMPIVKEKEIAYEKYLNIQNAINTYIKQINSMWVNELKAISAKKNNSLVNTLLDNSILTKIKDKYLENTYNVEIKKVLSEVNFWLKIKDEHIFLPNVINEISFHEDRLKISKEYVNRLVRNYNGICMMLNNDQYKIFEFILKNIYNNIENTMFKFNWNKDNIKLNVLFSLLNECINIKTVIATFKKHDEQIKEILNEIEQISIISIDEKRTYTLEEFEEEQNINIETIRSILRDKHTNIIKILKEMLLYIEKYSGKSLNSFKSYIVNVEKTFQKKYFISVKVSLYNYYKLLNDKISNDAVENYPLFKIYVKMNKNKELIYDFSHHPSKNLTDGIYKKASDMFYNFPKFTKVIFKNRQNQIKKKLAFAFSTPNINDKDSANVAQENTLKKNDNNNQCIKLLNQINTIYNNFMEKLKEKIKWLKYYNLKLLNLNEDELLHNLYTSEDTMRYIYNQINIFKNLEESIEQDIDKETILFIEINLSILKEELLSDFKKYKELFLNYINAKCKKKLEELYCFFKENSTNLLKAPADISALKEHNYLLEYCNNNYEQNKKDLDKLEEDYLKLTELKGELNEDEIMKLKISSILSNKFEVLLKESKKMYLDTKEKMKNEIKNLYNEFNKLWQKKKTIFYKEIPINIQKNPNDALEMIKFYEKELVNIKKIQDGLKNKIILFNIDDVCDEQIRDMEVDLCHLKYMWEMIKFWRTIFDFIKNVNIFYLYDILNNLVVAIKEYINNNLSETLAFLEEKNQMNQSLDMFNLHMNTKLDEEEFNTNQNGISNVEGNKNTDNNADENSLNKQEYMINNKISMRNTKNLNIKIFLNQIKTHFVDIFEQFLINMKVRNNWEIYKELKNNVGKLKFSLILVEILTDECIKFRHFKEIELKTNVQWNLNNITINDIVEHKLYKEIKFITILYNNAEKELFIENNLKKIINKYKNMRLCVSNYKYSFLIKDTDKIFNNINEDIFLLNNIKIYNFDINFLKKTEKWEGILGNLYDNLEIICFIQSKNEYLKYVLSSSGAMKPYLKKIYEQYNICNQKYVKVIKSFDNSYILDKINNNANIQMLLQIHKQLNLIEKSLESYLERKKSSFPRLYFLSNKEILEILGIYKDPMLLKKKIQKLFFSIYSIEFVPLEKKKKNLQINCSKPLIIVNTNECNKNIHNLGTNEKLISKEKPIKNDNTHYMHDQSNNPGVDNCNNTYYYSHYDIYIYSQCNEKIKLQKKMPLNSESSIVILNKLEENIYETLKLNLVNVQTELRGNNLKNWILNNPQQLVLASKCIKFTNDYEYSLMQIKKGSHIFVNHMKKENHKELAFLSDLIKTVKDKKNYIKISALIILESYYKDVAEKLFKNKMECNDNFLWLCQIKYILTEDLENTYVASQKGLSRSDMSEQHGNILIDSQTKNTSKINNIKNELDRDLINGKYMNRKEITDPIISSTVCPVSKKKNEDLSFNKKLSNTKHDVFSRKDTTKKGGISNANKNIKEDKKNVIGNNNNSQAKKINFTGKNSSKILNEKGNIYCQTEGVNAIKKKEKGPKNNEENDQYINILEKEYIKIDETEREEEYEEVYECEEANEVESQKKNDLDKLEDDENEEIEKIFNYLEINENDDNSNEGENNYKNNYFDKNKIDDLEEGKDNFSENAEVKGNKILIKNKRALSEKKISDNNNDGNRKEMNTIEEDVDDKNSKQLKYLKTINLMLKKSMTLYLHYFNNKRKYSYEYQGNSSRLVITPLTEKCFYSCLFSLDNFYVNAIKGETGVGKSETIKEFSKIFGTNIISINCNNNNTSKYIGNILSGLLQSGFWCCFDEFNRIEGTVIAVVVEQFRSIKHILHRLQFRIDKDGKNNIGDVNTNFEYFNYEDISSYHNMTKLKISNSENNNNNYNSFSIFTSKEISKEKKRKKNDTSIEMKKKSPTYIKDNSIEWKINDKINDVDDEHMKVINGNLDSNVDINESDHIKRDCSYNDNNKKEQTFLDSEIINNKYNEHDNIRNDNDKARSFDNYDTENKIDMNKHAYFEGKFIKINNNCSIYLTLCKNTNDCIYSLENYNNVIQEFSFKPPNFCLICQFSLASIGFKNSKKLSKKINTCYSLLYEFLSKQKQYTIDLREIKNLLNLVSDDFIRNINVKSEEEIIYDALVEVNESKLLKDDLNIFYKFLKDLFPLVKKNNEKKNNNETSIKIIENIMINMGYTVNDYYINSILKLYKIKKTNRGIIIVGKSCSGKTSIINIFRHYCDFIKNNNMCNPDSNFPVQSASGVVGNGIIEENGNDDKKMFTKGNISYDSVYNIKNKKKIIVNNEEFMNMSQMNNTDTNSKITNNKNRYESYNLLSPNNLFCNKYKNQGNSTNIIPNNAVCNKRLSTLSVTNSIQSKTASGPLVDISNTYKKGTENNDFNIDVTVFNPMSTDIKKLYGYYNNEKEIYEDGILSLIIKRLFENNNSNEKWLILDGPLDILTTEPLHSLLDEHRILTLINGNRIKFSDNAFIFFEIENLKNCAPSFISRSKIVFMNAEEFNYEWIFSSYLERNFFNLEEKNLVQGFFNKYVKKIMNAKKNNKYKLIIDVSDAHIIISVCQLYDMLCNLYDKNFPRNLNPSLCLEKLFLQSIIYIFSNILCPKSKELLDHLIKSIDSTFPHLHTIFDYIISKNNFNWVLWDELITTNHNFLPNVKEHFFSYDNYNFIKNDSNMKYMGVNQLNETLNPETDFNKFLLSSNLEFSKNFNKYTINYNNLFSDSNNKNTLDEYQTYNFNFMSDNGPPNANDMNIDNYNMFSTYSKDNIYSDNNFMDSNVFNTYSKNLSNTYFSDNTFSNNNFSDNLMSYKNINNENNNYPNMNNYGNPNINIGNNQISHNENINNDNMELKNNNDYNLDNGNLIESYKKSSLKNFYSQKDNLTEINGMHKNKQKYFQEKFNDNIYIENVESLRKKNIINILMYNKKNILLIGNKLSGKTFFMKYNILPYIKDDISTYYTFVSKLYNSNLLEKKIEINVEKKCRNIYKPIGNKKCLYFILDDLNNLQKYDDNVLNYSDHKNNDDSLLFDFNIDASRIAKSGNNSSGKTKSVLNTSILEFLNQFIDYNMYYNRDNATMKNIENLFFFLIYGNNKKYTSAFNKKLINRLHIVHLNEMDEGNIKNTFHVFLRHKFANFHEVIKNLAEPLSTATIRLFLECAKKFKPNLNCYHYFFHLKQIFKIIKGIFLSEASIYEEKESFLRLWANECFRVLGDQLILKNERKVFNNILKKILHKKFYVSYNYLFPKKKKFYFCSYNFHDPKNENPYFFYQPISNENLLLEFFKNTISSYNTFATCNYERKKKEYFRNFNEIVPDPNIKKKTDKDYMSLINAQKEHASKESNVRKNLRKGPFNNSVEKNYVTTDDIEKNGVTSGIKNDANDISNEYVENGNITKDKVGIDFQAYNNGLYNANYSTPNLNDEMNISLEKSNKMPKEIEILVNKNDNDFNNIKTPINFILFKEAMSNVCNFSRIFLFENEHFISIGDSSPGKFTCALIACFIYQIKIHVIKNFYYEHTNPLKTPEVDTDIIDRAPLSILSSDNNSKKINEELYITKQSNLIDMTKYRHTIGDIEKETDVLNDMEEKINDKCYRSLENPNLILHNLKTEDNIKKASINLNDMEQSENREWNMKKTTEIKINADIEDSNKVISNSINYNKSSSLIEKLKCNYFIKKFREALFNCYKNEKRCVLYYLDDNMNDEILEFLHELYNNENLINIFNSEEVAYLKNIFLENEISLKKCDTLSEIIQELIKKNYHYVLFTSLKSNIFRKISNEYNVILKKSTVNYFLSWKNCSYNVIAQEKVKINNINVDVFTILHNTALKFFEKIFVYIEDEINKKKQNEDNLFSNELIDSMNSSYYTYKNENQYGGTNINKYNEYDKRHGTDNNIMPKSKNIILADNKESMKINDSIQINTKENSNVASKKNTKVAQSSKNMNDISDDYLLTMDDKNDDDRQHNSNYIKSSKLVENKLNAQKYINFKHFLNFLQFFKYLYKKKSEEINDNEKKINLALKKLADAKNEIQEMQIKLSLQKENISKKQTECAQLLKEIEEKKKESNEKKKKIQEDSIRISNVEIETQKLAEDARKDLQNAIPELEVATQSLEQLDKKSISEVKAYTKPPDVVMQTLSIVMIILNKNPSWEQAKIELGDANFLNKLKSFDKDSVSDKTLKKIEKFTKNPIYSPKAVKKVSAATGALCMWIHALKMYAEVYREVAPKRLRLKLAEELLSKNRKELELAMEQLAEIEKNLLLLQEQHNESTQKNDELSKSYEESCLRIENVEKFFLNITDEKNRWEKYVKDNERIKKCVYGESILSSFFLVYTGLLNYEDRKFLIYDTCVNLLMKNHIYVNTNFNLVDYFIDPIQTLEFNINYLSNDVYMKENFILINNNFISNLIIDPHHQVKDWISRSYNNSKTLIISDFNFPDIFLKIIYCMNNGIPLLINNIKEKLEDILLLTIKKYNKFIMDRENNNENLIDVKEKNISQNDVLIKEYIKKKNDLYKNYVNNGYINTSNHKKISYEENIYFMKLQLLSGLNIHKDFKLFLVSNKNCFELDPLFYSLTTVILFNLNSEIIDSILLNVIIMNNEKNLEDENKESLLHLVHVKKEIIRLENNILEHVTKCQNKITEDDELINILLQSKLQIDQKNGHLEEINDTLNRMNMTKNTFKPLAKKVSILFTILNDLKYLNKCYQFSLNHFINFFIYNINYLKKNMKTVSGSVNERHEILFNNFFYEFIKYTKISLANKHHLFFVFYSLSRIMIYEDKISQEDYNFFIFGIKSNVEKEHLNYFKKIHIIQENKNSIKENIYNISFKNKGNLHDKKKEKGEKRKRRKPTNIYENKNVNKTTKDDEKNGKKEKFSDSYNYLDDDEEDDYEDEDDELCDDDYGYDDENFEENEEEEEDDEKYCENDELYFENSEEYENKGNGNNKDTETNEGLYANTKKNISNNNADTTEVFDKTKPNHEPMNNKTKRNIKKTKYNSNNKNSNEYSERNYIDKSKFSNTSNSRDNQDNTTNSNEIISSSNEYKSLEIVNPGTDWISEMQWKYLLDIEKLKIFEGFINSFIKSIREWRRWFNFLEVENNVLPDEWEFNLNSFQKLIIIKILRPDRLNKAIENFVCSNISYNDVEVDHMNFEYILRPYKNVDPITIIHKSNCDPFQHVYNYARKNNQKLKNLILTSHNINFVDHYLKDAMEKGHILFISNLPNSENNLHKLSKIIDNIFTKSSITVSSLSKSSSGNSQFRINEKYVSSSDHADTNYNNSNDEKKEYKSEMNESTITNGIESIKFAESNCNEPANIDRHEIKKNAELNKEVIKNQEKNYFIYEENICDKLENIENYYPLLDDDNEYSNNMQNLLIKKNNNESIKINDKFRLFLSFLPDDKFPNSLLQKSIIVILDEPYNIKKSISILFKEQWVHEEYKNIQLNKYKKVMLSLFWFHSILNNRKKFYSLGWNSENYFFSNKDVILSKHILEMFLNKNIKDIYWPYFHYYICDIIYGSQINDSFDKELLNIYAQEFFNDNIFKGKYVFSSCASYYLPSDINNEKALSNYLKEIPHNDSIEVFGQKPYSEITYNSIASEEIISLLFRVNSFHNNHYNFYNIASNSINEKKIYSFIKTLLHNMPHEIYVDNLIKKESIQEQYIYVNLMLQEIYKHNMILKKARKSLNKVQYAIKGETIINKKIYEIIKSLSNGLVPKSWKIFYIAKKKLINFFEDLNERIKQLNEWSINGRLQIHWLGGFYNPKSILKYILHEYSRKNEINHDLLTFEFISISNSDEFKSNSRNSEDGIYIKKVILQGAKWDFINQSLIENDGTNIYSIIPIVYLKVILKKNNKGDNNIYKCPLYISQEKNTLNIKENYLIKVRLGTGSKHPTEWGKMGVRLFLTNEH